jgi:zinc/manganese transport system permease protein
MLVESLLTPLTEYAFMRRALVGCMAAALGCSAVGVFLVLRRLSLAGDALSHAVLPGVAVGFLLAGLSLPAMSLGGLLAGLIVVLLAAGVSHLTVLREDASLSAFYLTSLALGVLLISARGSSVDLMHVLFGNVLAVDREALLLMAATASLTLVVLAVIFRALVIDSFDPAFLRVLGVSGYWSHTLFMALVVLNLVVAFQALGTLLAVGMMMLPAVAARLWTRHLGMMLVLACSFALLAAYAGLVWSYHADLASGPTIILTAGAIYVFSLLGGTQGLLRRLLSRHHLEA